MLKNAQHEAESNQVSTNLPGQQPIQLHIEMGKDAEAFKDTPYSELIHRFTVYSKSGKPRTVNNPNPDVKATLREWNDVLTAYYEQQLEARGITHIAQAYLPGKSIRTNAEYHKENDLIQFDFKGFYDSCRFDYFKEHLIAIDPSLTDESLKWVERLVIDPQTGGVTQGLPVSGALAGLSLLPFWEALERKLRPDYQFTQYSDDLTISQVNQGLTSSGEFTIEAMTKTIYNALQEVNLDFKLNDDKTRTESGADRKVTGIRINHRNQLTPDRKGYRFLRHALFVLSKSNDLERELAYWNLPSKASFVGKVSYMRSIDESGKIDKLIHQYRDTCERHGLFKTWLNAWNERIEKHNPFL